MGTLNLFVISGFFYFFFPFEVFLVCENSILLFGSETTEENAGAAAEQDCWLPRNCSNPNQLIGYVPLEASRRGWMYSSVGNCHSNHATCVNHINTPSFKGSPRALQTLLCLSRTAVGSTSSAALRDTQNIARKTEQAFPSV